MNVVDEHDDRADRGQPGENLLHRYEEVSTLLVARHLRGGRDVGVRASQVGEQAGDLACVLTDELAKALGCQASLRRFENLDEGAVRLAAAGFVAAPDEELQTSRLCLCADLLDETSLSDACAARDDDQCAPAVVRAVDAAAKG